MSKVLIIEKNKAINATICADFDDLYKKCKFKKADNFIKIYEFTNALENQKYCLYGRLVGKSSTINEYRFRGFDKTIYGACAVILTNLDNKIVDIIQDEWIKYNGSKIVLDIEQEIGNIIISQEKNKDLQGKLVDLEQEEEEEEEEEEKDDFKLNYGSELSEDMYIYSSDDE